MQKCNNLYIWIYFEYVAFCRYIKQIRSVTTPGVCIIFFGMSLSNLNTAVLKFLSLAVMANFQQFFMPAEAFPRWSVFTHRQFFDGNISMMLVLFSRFYYLGWSHKKNPMTTSLVTVEVIQCCTFSQSRSVENVRLNTYVPSSHNEEVHRPVELISIVKGLIGSASNYKYISPVI